MVILPPGNRTISFRRAAVSLNERAAQQWIAVIELHPLEAIQYSRADVRKPLHHLRKRWKCERGASGARMLERIVEPGHLRELDWSIEILGEPEFLEVRDVS